jgi:hypothetical protein
VLLSALDHVNTYLSIGLALSGQLESNMDSLKILNVVQLSEQPRVPIVSQGTGNVVFECFFKSTVVISLNQLPPEVE